MREPVPSERTTKTQCHSHILTEEKSEAGSPLLLTYLCWCDPIPHQLLLALTAPLRPHLRQAPPVHCPLHRSPQHSGQGCPGLSLREGWVQGRLPVSGRHSLPQMAGWGCAATPPAGVPSPCPRHPEEPSPGPRIPTSSSSQNPLAAFPGRCQVSALPRTVTEIRTGKARSRQPAARVLSPVPASPGDGRCSGKTPRHTHSHGPRDRPPSDGT